MNEFLLSGGFLLPGQLWISLLLLLCIPVCWFAFLLRAKARNAYALPAERKLLHSLILALGVLLPVSLAALRPHGGYETVHIPTGGRDILVALDVSRSMLANDTKPTRLAAARAKIVQLAGLLKARAQGDRLGIVLFAGSSYLFAPLTSDYAIIESYVKNISPDLISSPGSAINAAIDVAFDRLRKSGAVKGNVLIMSDGEDSTISWSSLDTALTSGRFTIDVLGFGTASGAKLYNEIGSPLRDQNGSPVTSRIDEKTLRELARRGGGTYRPASPGNADVLSLVRSLSADPSRPSLTPQGDLRIYREFGPLLSLLALLFCSVLIVLRSPALPLLGMLFVSLVSPTSIAVADPRQLWEGSHSYAQGNFADAEKALQEEALRPGEHQAKALALLGSAQLRQNQYADAAQSFAKAAELFPHDSPEKAQALYNQGNAELLAQKYQEAVRAYEDALTQNPRDTATNHNLEVAKTKLQQKKKEEQQKESPKDSPKQKDDGNPEEQHGDSKDGQNPDSSQNENKGSPDQPKNDENYPSDYPHDEQPERQDKSTEKQQGDSANTPESESQPEGGKSQGPSDQPEQSPRAQKSPSGGTQGPGERDLSTLEADRWLNSLGESNVSIYRSGAKVEDYTSPRGQTW